jgi:hypothetical protein
MVHALSEIRRVLVPNGTLLDLRPISDRWPIEVVSARGVREIARFQDLPIGLADDQAANRAMDYVAEKGWFVRDEETFFPYTYAWDTPSEMEEWLNDEWNESIALDEESLRATRSAWALGDADSRVRVSVKMLIARWHVVKE